MPGSAHPIGHQSLMIWTRGAAPRASIQSAISCAAPTCMGWRFRSCERRSATCRSTKDGCGNSRCAGSRREDMKQTRRLAAILAADVAGYSRLMGADEEGTLERLKALRHELLDPKIAEHHGRIVKTTGDGLLVEFASVVDAVRCAVAVQQAMPERNTS